jgi:acyl-CoA dehydrogenase
MILLARTTPLDEVKRKSEGMSIFLVDVHAAVGHGLTLRPIRNMVNHETFEAFFDNLEIPESSRIGEEGRGFTYILDGLNAERALIAAECIGDGYWFDRNQPCGAEANMAKYLAAKASWEAADVCLQTHGGFGFASEYDVERKFRETRLYQVAPISTNLILAYVAEHVLGLPRSY